jgi:hypothetical protein
MLERVYALSPCPGRESIAMYTSAIQFTDRMTSVSSSEWDEEQVKEWFSSRQTRDRDISPKPEPEPEPEPELGSEPEPEPVLRRSFSAASNESLSPRSSLSAG